MLNQKEKYTVNIESINNMGNGLLLYILKEILLYHILHI